MVRCHAIISDLKARTLVDKKTKNTKIYPNWNYDGGIFRDKGKEHLEITLKPCTYIKNVLLEREIIL